MGQIQDSHLSRGPWYEGNFFNDPGRRFETVYNNGLPQKRSGEAYLSSSYPFLPLVRRTEDDRPCMPCLIENNNTNGLRLGDEDTRCSEGSDSDCYYTKETIERLSPSRRDGIDLQKETFLRCSYVSFLQTLGMQLQLPQTTIATAIVLCHRFFLRRSHASNDRFLIATACIFLAAKSEETSRPLNNVLVMSYQMCHEQDLSSFQYLLPNDWFEQYRQCVIEAEHTLLTTLDFELTVQHAYRPLMSVLSKIGLAHTTLLNLAWNFINEGLRGSLCLQFKPHHIAAGAVSLASKVLNFDLSTTPSLWQEFQTTSTIIQDVVKQLTELS